MKNKEHICKIEEKDIVSILKKFVEEWNIENNIADSPYIHDGFLEEFIEKENLQKK